MGLFLALRISHIATGEKQLFLLQARAACRRAAAEARARHAGNASEARLAGRRRARRLRCHCRRGARLMGGLGDQIHQRRPRGLGEYRELLQSSQSDNRPRANGASWYEQLARALADGFGTTHHPPSKPSDMRAGRSQRADAKDSPALPYVGPKRLRPLGPMSVPSTPGRQSFVENCHLKQEFPSPDGGRICIYECPYTSDHIHHTGFGESCPPSMQKPGWLG